jgi:CII-binding regulator of phage lambda lysogenization HflD
MVLSHAEAVRSMTEVHAERERSLAVAVELLEEQCSTQVKASEAQERGHAAVLVAMEQRLLDSERSNTTVVKGLEEKIRGLQDSHIAITQALMMSHAEKESLLAATVTGL